MLKEVAVGTILRTHGVRGEVKVLVTSDDSERLAQLGEVTLRAKGAEMNAKIVSVRYFKDTAIVKFTGIDSPEEAYPWIRAEILIPRDEALPLGENEYFIGDLIGCRVFLEDGTPYGILTDVLRTGANDVYEVRTDGGKEVLIPAIRECIVLLRPEEEKIVVHLLPGLE